MAALDRACTNSTAQLKVQCGEIVIPAGTYTLTDTVFLTGDEAAPSATTNEGIWSFHLRGAGGGYSTQGKTAAQSGQCKTILKWDGSSAEPMIHVHGGRDGIISGMCLLLDGDQDGTTGTPPASVGILITADTTGSENEPSVGMQIKEVSINGFSSSYTNSNTHTSTCILAAPDDYSGDPPYATQSQVDDLSVIESDLACHRGVVLAQGNAGGVMLDGNRFSYEDMGVWVEDSDVTIRGGYSVTRADANESDGGAEATACQDTDAFLYIDANADHVGFYDHRLEADCGVGILTTGVRDDQTIVMNVELAVGGADAYGCTDLYDTGGPPQTSGSPDGYCDSDGTTVNGQNAIIDYAHQGLFYFVGFLGIRNDEIFANDAVYLHPGTGRLEFCERSNIDSWTSGTFQVSADAYSQECTQNGLRLEASSAPEIRLTSSTGADQVAITLSDNGSTTDMNFKVDDSTGDDNTYLTIDGANEAIYLLKPMVGSSTAFIRAPARVLESAGGFMASNVFYVATATADYTLPSCADSTNIGAYQKILVGDAVTASIVLKDPLNEIIKYPGLSLGVGDELDSSGSAGDYVEMYCLQVNTWWVVNNVGTFADGGPDD